MSLEIDCLKLIAAVKERVPLYDSNTKEHNDRAHKKQLWIEVCKEVFTPAVWDSLSVDAQGRNEIEVQKRWINLRHCFRRDIKKEKSLPPEERDRKRRKYIYSDELAFILPFLKNENESSEQSEPRTYRGDIVIDADILIPAVKARPPLYDATVKEYSDLDLKKTLWHEVCREVFTDTVWESMSENEQASHLHEVRKKWVNLRHCFRRDIMTQIKMESEGKKREGNIFTTTNFRFCCLFTRTTKARPYILKTILQHQRTAVQMRRITRKKEKRCLHSLKIQSTKVKTHFPKT